MSEFERFTHEISGEEPESFVEKKASGSDIFLTSTLFKMKHTPTSNLPDMKKYMLPDETRGAIQEIRSPSTHPKGAGCLNRVWQAVSALWYYPQKNHSVELTPLATQESILLHELLVHVQSILLLPPFAFSEAECQKILKETRVLAQQDGYFALGLLLFLIDRQPEGFIACVETPLFSGQTLSVWVQKEGKKKLYKEIEEVTSQEALHGVHVSDRMAKTITSILITRAGLCNIGLLEDLTALLAPFLSSSEKKHGEFCLSLEKRLQLLRHSSNLRQKVHYLSVPESDTVGAACIRASWHLNPETPLTCKDARKTLLATFLSHLRQQKGDEDCFAVALIISVMEESPQQVMDDLSSLLLHGGLTRIVDGKAIVFPWIAAWQEEKEFNLSLQRGWRQVVASMSETPKQGRCTKCFTATIMPLFHTLGASHASPLANTVETLLKGSFRWIYEPAHSLQQEEKGAFALYKEQGKRWKRITSSEELLAALEDFIKEKWPDREQRLEKQQMLHAQLIAEESGLRLTNRYREGFHLAPLASSSGLSTLHFAPWVTYIGGNVESVWHTYYDKHSISPSKKKPVSRTPQTGEQLINLLAEWMQWQKKTYPFSQTPPRLIVRIKDVHAFTLLPSKALLKLSSEAVSVDKWVQKHLKDPLMSLSDSPPSEELREKFVSFVSKYLIAPENRASAEKTIEQLDCQLSLSQLRTRLCFIALEGRTGVSIPFREEIESKIDAQLIQLLSPKEKALLERHTLMIGDSNWDDEEGKKRYIYLAMHPGSKQLTLFVGDLDQGEHQPLAFMPLPNSPWLNRRWKLLQKVE